LDQREKANVWFKKPDTGRRNLPNPPLFGAIVKSPTFAVCGRMWEKGCMNPKRIFNLLIALTVAAGLLSAPLAAPVVAKSHHAAVADMHAADMHAMDGDMPAMADGMPCCPDEGKPAKGCDSCPLVALCSLTMPVPAPSAFVALAPESTAQTAFAFPDDLMIDGLGARPPDHPPRTIV
jgi:hypothetical protein